VSGAPGGLYGIRMNHAGALASTCREPTPLVADTAAMRQVATYARPAGAPFRVVHDTTVNRPYGRFAVYVAERRIGSQLSFPNESDCRHMESPPAPLDIRVHWSTSARRNLGLLSPEEKAVKAKQHREYMQRRRRQERAKQPRGIESGKT
jgi:hypothetical protein